jgi:hypothetical protein
MLNEGVYKGFFERRLALKLNKVENFVFGVPTLFNYDGLNKLLHSILEQTLWPKEIIICDNGRSINLEKYKCFPIPVCIIYPSYNKGCGGGWNDIIRYAGNSDVLLASDDTEFIYKDSIEKMYCYTLPEFDSYHFVYGYGYSCFFASRRGINKIGLFDENIWPALYEDTDYSTRIDVLNASERSIRILSLEVCKNYSFTVTKHFTTEVNINLRNKNYVYKKWNYINKNLPTHPFYKQPFCNQFFDGIEFEIANTQKTQILKDFDFTKFKNKIILVEIFDEELILNLKQANVKGIVVINNNPKLDKFYIIFKSYSFYFRVFNKFDDFFKYQEDLIIDYYIGYSDRKELVCDKIIL